MSYRIRPSLPSFPSLGVLSILVAAAPAQTLVRDICPGIENPSATFSTQPFLASGGLLYFSTSMTQLDVSDEVWVTDGSPNGAHPIFTVRGTPWALLSTGFTTLPNGLVAFRHWTPEGLGFELHVTNGTEAGTALVADIRPGSGSGLTRIMGLLGNRVLLAADDGFTGRELWASDGTPAGTSLLRDIHPGAGSSYPGGINFGPNFGMVFQGRYYFAAEDGNVGNELWVTDGTPAGTHLLADIHPSGDSDPREFQVVGNLLVFAATDATSGRELWRTDGTAVGTVLAADVQPGAGSSTPTQLEVVGNTCFFAADDGVHGDELWGFDGSTATLVRDITPGAFGSSVRNTFAVNGLLLFTAVDGVTGHELWSSDGTSPGTALVADLSPGGAHTLFNGGTRFLSIGSHLVFTAAAQTAVPLGSELYVTDGTPAGTGLVRDIWPGHRGSDPRNLTSFNGRVYFTANDGIRGQELWSTDLTTAGTALVQEIVPPRPRGSAIQSMVALGNRVIFDADDGGPGDQVWVSDGTLAGTGILVNLVGSWGPRQFTRCQGLVYFITDSANGGELWVTDGTPGGTVMLPGVSPSHVIEWHGALYALGPNGLWRTDGTAAGTVLVASLGNGDYSVAPLIALPDRLLIQAGTSLMTSDGTTTGTVLVDPDNPVSCDYRAPTLAIGDHAYFFGNRGGLFELWRTDGTAIGTQHVRQFDLGSPPSLGGVYHLARLGERLVVAAGDDVPGGLGTEVYVSDGTPAGTTLLRDISPGPGSDSFPFWLTSAHDRVFFSASDGVHGNELWVTDGTTAGTVLVSDLEAGPHGAMADKSGISAAGVGRRVVVAAHQAATGTELWVSDGTAVGTQLLFELQPGQASGVPGVLSVPNGPGYAPPLLMVQAGDRLFFVGNDAVAGAELFVAPFSVLQAAEAQAFGTGCTGGAGLPVIGYAGAPVLGDTTFAPTLAHATPAVPALLLANFTRTDLPLSAACTVHPTLPAISLQGLTTANGMAAMPVPVPSATSLIGLDLYFQWAVLDPLGAFANLLAFSDGLRVRIGKS